VTAPPPGPGRPGDWPAGAAPEPVPDVIERAFDYRGNTTVVRTDGTEIEGYVFNRNADVPEPFIQLFDVAGEGPITIPYAHIRTIRFTGRDTAAGGSYEAWLRTRGPGEARPGGDRRPGE
jgi:hypothetical protein